MIPLAIPNLSGNEARYLQECVDTNFVSSVGPFVSRFEGMVAEAAGARGAVATSAGTTGLHAALTAVGVGRDDLVILPSFTFVASANAIAHCGALPWLFDIAEDSWTLDAEQIQRVLESETERRDGVLVQRSTGRRVAAMLPVYALGVPADMDRLVDIGRRFGLPIVADAAAALGATYKRRAIGALGANLTVFSFNGNKTITAGGGGAVAGDDERLIGLVRHLTTTARCGAEYSHDRVGFNYRMTNLQAAVGCAQLEQLDRFVAAKQRIARLYDTALGRLAGVRCFPRPVWAESACWLSGICISKPPLAEVISALRASAVEARSFWKPIHLQVPYQDAPAAPLPIADRVWGDILTLPCSTNLTDVDQRKVITAVSDALSLHAEPTGVRATNG
jgi:dTDP-4-amino-4,6-dideoxygalactose transaminase